MTRYAAFTVPHGRRIARGIRTLEGMPGVFVRIPERIPRWSAASCGCPEVHEITTTGSPSGGSSDLTYDIGGMVDTVTIAYDDGAAEVQAAFEAHDGVSSVDVSVTGGDLPRSAIYVRFTGNLKGETIAVPAVGTGITGGELRVRKASSHDWGA